MGLCRTMHKSFPDLFQPQLSVKSEPIKGIEFVEMVTIRNCLVGIVVEDA